MSFQLMTATQAQGGSIYTATLAALDANFADAITRNPVQADIPEKITIPAGAGTEKVWIVDTSRSVTGGGSTFRVQCTHATGALTGSIQGIRVRTQNNVASMTGKIEGLEAYASNNAASSGGTVHAAEIWALAKGFNIGTIRAIECGLDFDGGETVTEAVVLRVVSQAAGTITTHYGINVVDDSASSPGGRVYTAFIAATKTASQLPGAFLDSTGVVGWAAAVAGISLTAGDVPLLAYKDKDGTAHVLVMADNDTVVIRT